MLVSAIIFTKSKQTTHCGGVMGKALRSLHTSWPYILYAENCGDIVVHQLPSVIKAAGTQNRESDKSRSAGASSWSEEALNGKAQTKRTTEISTTGDA